MNNEVVNEVKLVIGRLERNQRDSGPTPQDGWSHEKQRVSATYEWDECEMNTQKAGREKYMS
jgi:hypothetical protein